MKVHWTNHAKRRLHHIHDHIATTAPKAADQTIRKILLRSRQIGDLPYAGREVPEYRREDIRELLVRPYRIIYRLRTRKIDVLTVMHFRQLLPEDSHTFENEANE